MNPAVRVHQQTGANTCEAQHTHTQKDTHTLGTCDTLLAPNMAKQITLPNQNYPPRKKTDSQANLSHPERRDLRRRSGSRFLIDGVPATPWQTDESAPKCRTAF